MYVLYSIQACGKNYIFADKINLFFKKEEIDQKLQNKSYKRNLKY